MSAIATAETPFHFFVPADVVEKSGSEPGRSRRIGGFISTEHRDRQKEIILQNGLDVAPFLEGGWFNDNHDKSMTSAVGFPELAERRTTPDGRLGTYVEGYLLEGYSKADQMWEQIQALKKANWPRRIGFSVEGGIQQRQGHDGKTVSKAVVRHVAITHVPINTQCQLDALSKALTAGVDVSRPPGGPDGGSTFALRTESLESRPKKKRKKRLTKSEAMARLLDRGYSVAMAERVWNLVIKRGD